MRSRNSLKPLVFGLILAAPLAMGACTFKVGEPLRIYDASSPSKSKGTDTGKTSGKNDDASTPKPSPTPACSVRADVNERNLPQQQVLLDGARKLNDQIDAEVESTGMSRRVVMARMLRDYAREFLTDKADIRRFAESIIALEPAPDSRDAGPRPKASPSPSPSTSPQPPAPKQVPASAVALAVHMAAMQFAEKPLELKQASTKAEFARKFHLQADNAQRLGAYQKAFALAMAHRPDGLGAGSVTEAAKFADSVIARPAPGMVIVKFEEIFRYELSLNGGDTAQAESKAREQACLAN